MKKFLFTLLLSCFSAFIYANTLTAQIEVNGTPEDSVGLCGIGDDRTLNVVVSNGSGNYTYLWSCSIDPTQVFPTNTSVVTFTANSIGTYTVVCKVTDNNTTNTASDTIIVTVNSNPDLFVGLDQKICHGNCVDLNCQTTTGDGLIWYKNNVGGLIVDSTSMAKTLTAHVCPLVSTNYWALSYNSITGCTKAKEVKVTVINFIATAKANPKIVCANGSSNLSVVLAGNPTPPTLPCTYVWSPTTGLSNPNISNPVATVTTTTTYCVTVYDNNGCSEESCVTVNVPPHPIVEKDTTICHGGCATLTAITSDTLTPLSYQWSTGAITTVITQCPASTKIYAVTVTDRLGCKSSDSATVTVSPLLVAEAGLSKKICAGSCDTIGGKPTASGGTPPYTYNWSSSPAGFSSNVADTSVCPIVNTTYKLTVTDSLGCTAIDSVLITVRSKPTADAGRDTTICNGSCVQIGGNPTASGGTLPYTYNWSPSAGLNNNIISNPLACLSGNTTYIVTVTDSLGCTATDAVNILSSPLPIKYNVTGGDTTICPSNGVPIGLDTTQIGISYVLILTGTPSTVLDTVPGTGTIPNSSITFGNFSTPGTYIVIAYNTSTGCLDTMAGTAVINNLPIHNTTIFGPDTVCAGTKGNIYKTQLTFPTAPNIKNFTWTVSSGGVVTAGGTSADSSITITWNTPGAQTVSVTDTFSNGCSATATYSVFVEPLPVPTITGPTPVCLGVAGNIYSTQAGMTNYTWTVTGGTITSGALTDSITVTWTTAGLDTVKVKYTNSKGCTDTTATVYQVTVNPLPVPAITGPNPVCLGVAGNVYVTQAGMTNYIWTVYGGVITAGGTVTADTAVVTWNTAGIDSVTVNYTNTNGCTGTSSFVYHVTVNPLPLPTITGPTPVCAGATGNVYTTQAGMTNYVWSVSPSTGYTITSGGTATADTAVITWTTAGTYTVSVNYANSFGCVASTATTYTVTVNPIPVPIITGVSSACVGTTGNVYTTDAGMTNYVWSVSSGGTITSGAATNSITVTWTATGAQTVSVSYTNSFGCPAATATVYNVTVNSLPTPTITGPTPVCLGVSGNVYTTQAGMTNYTWIPYGGSITAGGTATSNTATITWTTAGLDSVKVNYTNTNGCTATSSFVYYVIVNPLPLPTLAGPTPVCAGTTGNVYTTQAGMTNYVWSVFPSTGYTITSGGTATSNTATITWTTAGTYTVSINYANSFGCIASSATKYTVTVNPIPVPIITGASSACVGTTGNIYTTQAGMTNYVWTVSGGVITAGGTATSNTATITWNTTGVQTVSVSYTNSFGCSAASATVYNVTVHPLPTPTLTGPSSACLNEPGNVYTTDAGMTNYAWTVSGGTITAGGTATSSTATVTWTSVGTHTISVNYTNANGCTAASPVIYTVTVNPLPVKYTVTGGGQYCAGGVGLPVGLSNSQMGVSYQLQVNGNNDGSPVNGTGTAITFGNQTAAGTYTVIATNTTTTCQNNMTGSVTIVVNTVTITFNPSSPSICLGQNLNLCASGGNTYLWNTGSATACIQISPTINTTYSVTVTNTTTGCSNSASVLVTVNPIPAPTITGLTPVCEGTTEVYTTQSGMTNYLWTVSGGTITSGGTSTDSTITITWGTAGAGAISVNYTNSFGCNAALPTFYNIIVNPLPDASFALIPVSPTSCASCDGSVSIFNDETVPISSYLWSNGLITPSISDLCPNNYSVTVTTTTGCEKAYSTVVVPSTNILELGIVNTFSPNGDGINDVWEIKNIDMYPDNTLTVVNRWGNEVYSVSGYKNNWDGSRLSEGTYFYYLKVKMCGEDKTYKGYITIVR